MSKYPLGAKHPVVGLSTGERRSAKLFSVETWGNELDVSDQARQDLLTDTFFAQYKANPVVRDDIPDDRIVNRAVISKALESIDSSKTGGNLVTSLVTTPILYGALTSDQFIKDALEKQKELEDKEQELQGAQENNAGQDELDQLQQEYEDMKTQLEQKVEADFGDVMKTASMRAAVNESNDEAENVNAFMKSWGKEPGDVTNRMDAEEVIKAYKKMSLQNAGKMIGRSKALSSKTIQKVKRTTISQATVYDFSHDLTKITASERAMLLSDDEEISLMKEIQFINNGLFATIPIEQRHVKGNTVIVVDESVSLGVEGCQREKAMALGICQAIREDMDADRYYEMWGFAHGHETYNPSTNKYELDRDTFTHVNSLQKLSDHFDWATKYLNGGTDFDSAIELAMTRIKELGGGEDVGFDLTMFSDGICRLSKEVKAEIQRMKDEYHMKFVYIQIGYYHNQDIKDVADVYIEIPDGGSIDDVSTIEKIVETIAEHYLNKFAMGD